MAQGMADRLTGEAKKESDGLMARARGVRSPVERRQAESEKMVGDARKRPTGSS